VGLGVVSLMMPVGLLLIALVIVVIMRQGQPQRPPADEASALAVLQRRYAAGAIDEAEFHRRLAELMGSSRPQNPAPS
jgi:uncharacterized membrane protein